MINDHLLIMDVEIRIKAIIDKIQIIKQVIINFLIRGRTWRNHIDQIINSQEHRIFVHRFLIEERKTIGPNLKLRIITGDNMIIIK